MILCLIKLCAGHKELRLRCRRSLERGLPEGAVLSGTTRNTFQQQHFLTLLNLEQKSPQLELELTAGVRLRPVAGMDPRSPSGCDSTFTLVSLNFLGSPFLPARGLSGSSEASVSCLRGREELAVSDSVGGRGSARGQACISGVTVGMVLSDLRY